MKIMIVEDDPVIREHLAEALKKWRYEVYISNNFNDIIEEFNDYKPHIVLLDINLLLIMVIIGVRKVESGLPYRY